MVEISMIGVDLAKHVFQLHGARLTGGWCSGGGRGGSSCWRSSRRSRLVTW